MKLGKNILASIKSLEDIYLVETLTESCFFTGNTLNTVDAFFL